MRATKVGGGGSSTGTTEAAGKYELTGLTGGNWTVSFIPPNLKYQTLERSLTFTEGASETLNAQLVESGTITGTVTSAATGVGVPGDLVLVSSFEGFEIEEAVTDVNGHYTLEGLAPGSYAVEFGSIGEFIGQFDLDDRYRSGDERRQRRASRRRKDLRTGSPTPTAMQASRKSTFSHPVRVADGGATTNANGEYTINGLGTGSYKLFYDWEFSEAEDKQFEKAPRFIPKYIEQWFNGQLTESTANTVAASEDSVTSGINVSMVPSAPFNTALPAISGTSTVGSVLSCSNGSWTGESTSLSVGWPLTTPFSYQWQRDGVAITGATSQSYLLQAADVGHGLTCEVTASTEAGKAAAKSATFTVAKPVPVIKAVGSRFKVKKNATTVTLSCSSAAPCVGSIKATEVRTIVKHKGKKTTRKKQTLVLATGSYSLAAGKSGAVTLRLSAAGKKKLAKAHRASPKLIVLVSGGKAVERKVQLLATK